MKTIIEEDMKKLLIIDSEDIEDVVSVLESRVLTAGTRFTHKPCINLLDNLYQMLDPKRWKEDKKPCALGTCASPEWTCNICPFANRRPFSENLQWKAKAHYKREQEGMLYWKRFIKGEL